MMGGGETDLLVVGWAGENSIRFSGGLAANLNIRDKAYEYLKHNRKCNFPHVRLLVGWFVGPIGLT